MDFGSAVVADKQPFELVQPGEGALDDPADSAETGSVVGAAASDHGFDPARAEEATVFVVVVAAVADHPVGTSARPADEPGDRRYPLKQRDQLGDVVAVTAGQRPRERDPGCVDEEVVLRALPAPVDRARARFGAPFFAWMWLPSTTARAHSISPAARNRVNSNACSCSHTPARCHSSSRRQQVYPEP